jgi:integrase
VLFNSTLDPVVKMFIYLCATCGLRTSEALALRRSDIVGEGIVVQQHLTQYGLVSGLKRGDWRKIKVTDEFFALLANLDPAASYVIYGDRLDTHANLQSFRSNRMKPLYDALGYPFSNHALRHFAATNWIAEGRDLVMVQRMLGHKSIVTTLAYYGHLLKEPDAVHSYFSI